MSVSAKISPSAEMIDHLFLFYMSDKDIVITDYARILGETLTVNGDMALCGDMYPNIEFIIKITVVVSIAVYVEQTMLRSTRKFLEIRLYCLQLLNSNISTLVMGIRKVSNVDHKIKLFAFRTRDHPLQRFGVPVIVSHHQKPVSCHTH